MTAIEKVHTEQQSLLAGAELFIKKYVIDTMEVIEVDAASLLLWPKDYSILWVTRNEEKRMIGRARKKIALWALK